MALVKSILQANLQQFGDSLYATFTSYPKDVSDMANKWGDALDEFITSLVPPTTTSQVAKESFIAYMNGLVEPIPENTYHEPFTLGFLSHESRLLLFSNYLNQIGYKSNPELDRSAQITIIIKIRDSYNKLYPSKALTEDIIIYNQNRHNFYYAQEIANGTRLALVPDGIIGDDTIKYKPTGKFNPFQALAGNGAVALSFDGKVIGQPSYSGNISFEKYTKGIPRPINSSKVYNDYIRKNLLKDYVKFPLDKTQSDSGETDYIVGSSSLPMAFYINTFQSNHITSDPIWKANKITSITAFNIFKRAKEVIYQSKPDSKKNGLTLLSDALAIYAQELAVGMQPTFTAVPPPININLTSVSTLGLSGGSTEDCLSLLSSLIIAWLQTGTATNNSSGASIPWS